MLKKQISWVFHVDSQFKESSIYDMIIRRDLLGELGITLHLSDKTVTWETDTIPMKDKGTLNSQDALAEVYLSANKPENILDEFLRSTKILDAEDKPAILEEAAQMCENLSQETTSITLIIPKI
jgi:hypothetical protein